MDARGRPQLGCHARASEGLSHRTAGEQSRSIIKLNSLYTLILARHLRTATCNSLLRGHRLLQSVLSMWPLLPHHSRLITLHCC
jgi:hypothetical protein